MYTDKFTYADKFVLADLPYKESKTVRLVDRRPAFWVEVVQGLKRMAREDEKIVPIYIFQGGEPAGQAIVELLRNGGIEAEYVHWVKQKGRFSGLYGQGAVHVFEKDLEKATPLIDEFYSGAEGEGEKWKVYSAGANLPENSVVASENQLDQRETKETKKVFFYLVLACVAAFSIGEWIHLKERSIDAEFQNLTGNGRVVKGEITHLQPYFKGSYSTNLQEKIRSRLATASGNTVGVDIAFWDGETGAEKKLYEDWPISTLQEYKVGDWVDLVYAGENKRVKVASFNNPRLQTALRIAQGKITRSDVQKAVFEFNPKLATEQARKENE